MKVICKTQRVKIVENQGYELAVQVRLRAPAQSARAQRAPLCIAPVVDVSGSMEGKKLDSVRRALERLITHLVPGDRVGLVTFDAEAKALMPVVEVTERRKTELRQMLRQL